MVIVPHVPVVYSPVPGAGGYDYPLRAFVHIFSRVHSYGRLVLCFSCAIFFCAIAHIGAALCVLLGLTGHYVFVKRGDIVVLGFWPTVV